ncbi:MAG: phosphate acyltransferase PlsX [Acidobacteria bacterium]|nr:phosphate acyltransferase PlsX [Acidobacteriota bacterium]
MGGDHAPGLLVEGAVWAARTEPVAVRLVGPAGDLARELARHPGSDALALDVIDAVEVIEMGDAPVAALRRKRRASIRVAAEALARGEAEAMFSAGHTGATLVAAHEWLGPLPGVDRPALAATVPTVAGAAVLVDAGANVACRPDHLVQFAVMGSVYASLALGVASPRVGLLSTGEEESKGNDLTREAHRRLKSAPVRFLGNIEACDIYTGRVDVIVCDGFTGNVALKVSEGLVEAVEQLLREELSRTFPTRLGSLMSQRAFHRFRRRVDYSEYGGAPLLGVGGVCLVGHGRSTARAVRNAIALAARFARDGLGPRLAAALSASGAAGVRTST